MVICNGDSSVSTIEKQGLCNVLQQRQTPTANSGGLQQMTNNSSDRKLQRALDFESSGIVVLVHRRCDGLNGPVRSSVNNRNSSTPSRNPRSGSINDTALRWLFYSAKFPLLFVVAI
nr:hypothetical protein Iba_scaffold60676CG0010 [Ipomoea batatas]GMC78958.1 hypothetical protein Iba_chr04aCG6460 [Ipomoea batatas]GMD98799.1 hypothetical protein Iba_scaffold1667851CG0010 [Ipomoea batatas]